MNNKHTRFDASLFALRLTVGLYMLLAGVGKVQGEINNGIGHFYKGPFSAMQPDWLPDAFATSYGYALPWLEVLVGLLLIIGLFTRIVGFAGLGMLVSFTIALAIKFNSITAQADGPGGPFNANYIQWAAYLALMLLGAGAWSVDAVLAKKRKKD